MVNLLLGNHVYLPDLIKFQRPLAAPLKMSTSSLQGQDHKTAETLFCDEIWICKTRLNLTPWKEKKVRRCFKTDIIRKKKAFIRRRRGGGWNVIRHDTYHRLPAEESLSVSFAENFLYVQTLPICTVLCNFLSATVLHITTQSVDPAFSHFLLAVEP